MGMGEFFKLTIFVARGLNIFSNYVSVFVINFVPFRLFFILNVCTCVFCNIYVATVWNSLKQFKTILKRESRDSDCMKYCLSLVYFVNLNKNSYYVIFAKRKIDRKTYREFR